MQIDNIFKKKEDLKTYLVPNVTKCLFSWHATYHVASQVFIFLALGGRSRSMWCWVFGSFSTTSTNKQNFDRTLIFQQDYFDSLSLILKKSISGLGW